MGDLNTDEPCVPFDVNIIKEQRLEYLRDSSTSSSSDEEAVTLRKSPVIPTSELRRVAALQFSSSDIASEGDEVDKQKYIDEFLATLYRAPGKYPVEGPLKRSNMLDVNNWTTDIIDHVVSHYSNKAPLSADMLRLKYVNTINRSQSQDIQVLSVNVALYLLKKICGWKITGNVSLNVHSLSAYNLNHIKQPNIIVAMFLCCNAIYYCLHSGKYGKAYECIEEAKSLTSNLLDCLWTAYLYNAEALLMVCLGQIQSRKANYVRAYECLKKARACCRPDLESKLCDDVIFQAIYYSTQMSMAILQFSDSARTVLKYDEFGMENSVTSDDLSKAVDALEEGKYLMQFLSCRFKITSAGYLNKVEVHVGLRKAQLRYKLGKFEETLKIVNDTTYKLHLCQQSEILSTDRCELILHLDELRLH